jgi:hypothetical protein
MLKLLEPLEPYFSRKSIALLLLLRNSKVSNGGEVDNCICLSQNLGVNETSPPLCLKVRIIAKETIASSGPEAVTPRTRMG